MHRAPGSMPTAKHVMKQLLNTGFYMVAGAIHQELARRNTVLLYAYLRRGPEEAVLGYIV